MRVRDAVQIRKAISVRVCICLFAFGVGAVLEASAQVETLSNANSTVTINTSSQTGMNSWVINGQNVLSQQWFWFRASTNGPTTGLQSSIDTLGAPVNNLLAPNYLQSTYSGNPNFSLQVVYSLVGGTASSGASDLSEQIKIQNLTSGVLNFNFFQYANFATGPGGDLVQLSQNARGLYNEALVTSGAITISEDVDTALSPGANEGSAAQYDNTLFNLNNTPGLVLDDVPSSGPGGTNTWAFEWDKSIAAGGSLIISKDLNVVVPEPGTLAVAFMGLAGIGIMCRRRSSALVPRLQLCPAGLHRPDPLHSG
jgi:hypothetical protein